MLRILRAPSQKIGRELDASNVGSNVQRESERGEGSFVSKSHPGAFSDHEEHEDPIT
jgi:hypothetical protein